MQVKISVALLLALVDLADGYMVFFGKFFIGQTVNFSKPQNACAFGFVCDRERIVPLGLEFSCALFEFCF